MSLSPLVKVQRWLLTFWLLAVLLASACSDREHRTSAVGLGGGTPRAVGSPCESGQTRPCSITLSRQGDVLECFHGTQQCRDGHWDACGNGTVTQQAAVLTPALQSLAISDPEACENNPCNPFCRWFNEVPDSPLAAVESVTGYVWESGSLAALPGAVLETALNQPCRTGADCQFNTRCENPNTGSCAHSVCETGSALSGTCSQCTGLVYDVAVTYPEAYGQCFGMPSDPAAEECVHDPCATGTPLKQNCDTRVAQLCADAAYASCCDESWGMACAAQFRTLNPGVCQCGPGEVARNGECLFYNGAALSWLAAQSTCRNRGDAWDLASVTDASENAFILDTWSASGGSGEAGGFWIGLTDSVDEGTWAWSSGASPGAWQEATRSGMYANWCGPNAPEAGVACPGDASEPSPGVDASCASVGVGGGWQAKHCSNASLPSVCEGPPLHSGAEAAAVCPSAGEYAEDWAFYQNYTGFQQHFFEPGDYIITVVARGDYAGGEWPAMELGVDFEAVGTQSINDSNWKSYTFEYTATASETIPIMISFINDWSDGSSDRNFYTTSISVECAGSLPSTPTWGSECVGIAEETCDISCNPTEPATGACVPWLPGETDPSCPDQPDLSLGVPCGGSVPVCNHGQLEAPPGLTLVHFPESANQFGSPNPTLNHPELITCRTTEPIAPGACISLADDDCVDNDGAAAELSGLRHIMVNPPGPNAVSECSGLDNWAIFVDGVECATPACSGGTTAATSTRMPVDIIFIIDNSGSMEEEIFQVEQRINEDFAEIIEQSGLDYRVIMISRYGDLSNPFGDGGGTSYPICVRSPLGGTDCLDPDNQVPLPGQRFFHYSARVGSNNALCLLLDGFSAPDELAVQDRPGWQVQAPNGFGAWLRPDAFKTFVVITDDNVDCSTSGGLELDDTETSAGGALVGNSFDAALRTLSPGQFEDADGQRNYVWHSIINIHDNDPLDEAWASDAPIQTELCSGAPGTYVGPGTGYQALSRLTGGLRYPSCRTADFDAVFNTIAEQVIDVSAASCAFRLDGADIDPAGARVSYRSSSDELVVFSQVADAASCESLGWYLEPQLADATSTLSLCPASCALVQADAGAHVFVEVDCEMPLATTSHTQTYAADCEAGSIVEWRALGYDTTIQDDAVVQFRVRTGHTLEELPQATYEAVNTATATQPDCFYLEPMACTPTDTDCNCVQTAGVPGGIAGGVALNGDKLDAIAASKQYLELEITIVPGASAPTVEAWKVAYSCLPGE